MVIYGPLRFYESNSKSLWKVPNRIRESASHGELSSPPDPSRPMVPWKHSTQIHHTWPRIPHVRGCVSDDGFFCLFVLFFRKKTLEKKSSWNGKDWGKYMKVHDAPELFKDFHCSTVSKPPRVGSTQLVNSLIFTIQSKTPTFYRSNATRDLRVVCGSANLTMLTNGLPNGSSLGTSITNWDIGWFQESYNIPLEHTPGNPPTQLWKDSLYNLLVKA